MLKKKVSFLIPCYNEERTLPALHSALVEFIDSDAMTSYDVEVLLVDDGSHDTTLDILRNFHDSDPRFSYLSLSRNFGKENALLAGFDFVTGDCAVIMDADLQHPLDVVPEMIRKWQEGYDDVYGLRQSRDKESWLRRKATDLYYWLLKKSSPIDMIPNVGDFRLLDRRCIAWLRRMRESQRYTKGLYAWMGFRKTAVPFECADSVRGASKFSYASLFNLAIDGITGFSTAPLRIASILGILISFVAFLYIIWIVLKVIIFGEVVQGFPTLICTILFMAGVQLLVLGIIGEYIGRIFNETKNRPPYIPSSYNGTPLEP